METKDYLNQLEEDRQDLVDNLQEKGITGLTGDETFTTLVPEVLNIPSGGGTVEAPYNDVIFYDYDGTRLYSYTKSEFLALTEMPANPEHEGLTARGWNWTLSDAKEYVTTNGILDIGQMCVTSDNSIKIYMTLSNERLSPKIGFAINGTATIEWGDNTTSTVTGTSTSTVVNTEHTYSSGGKYVIKIKSTSTIYLTGNSSDSNLITATYSSMYYKCAVDKIELGNNVDLGNYCFYYMYNLKAVNIPYGISAIREKIFASCYSLKHYTIPTSVTTINYNVATTPYSLESISYPKDMQLVVSFQSHYLLKRLTLTKNKTGYGNNFQSCYTLKELILPNDLTTISSSSLNGCVSLTKLFIPATVVTIQVGGFQYCRGMKCYDFSTHTTIPTLYNGVFEGIQSDCKIVVPDDLYETWKTTSNWSTYSSYIIKKTDWDALNS